MVKIDVPQQQYMKTLETGHGRIFYNKLTEIHLLDQRSTFLALTIWGMLYILVCLVCISNGVFLRYGV